MLGGEYRHTLDPKNRIFTPAKLRDELGSTFCVAKSLRDKCLKVFSLAGWEAYLAPLREQNRKLQDQGFRILNSTSAQVTPDAQGRILLTQELVDYAEIEKNAVVVGCGDYAEIWSEENYEKMKSETDMADILRQLEELGL